MKNLMKKKKNLMMMKKNLMMMKKNLMKKTEIMRMKTVEILLEMRWSKIRVEEGMETREDHKPENGLCSEPKPSQGSWLGKSSWRPQSSGWP